MAEQYANRTKQHRESTVNRLHTSDAFKPLVLVVASKGAKLLEQQNQPLGTKRSGPGQPLSATSVFFVFMNEYFP